MAEIALRTAQPASIPTLLSPIHMVTNLWARRDLIRQFGMRYFHARYRGTHLGMVWALIFPLTMLAVYTFIFNYVFNARSTLHPDETRTQYAVWLFCGMTTYAIFSESVMRSCSLVLDNTNYVTKIVFPLEIMTVSSMLSTLCFYCFSLALTLIGVGVGYHTFHWTIVLLPVILLPLVVMSIGIGWFLASLAVFIRDIGNLVAIVVSQLLFFLTPIFYRAEDLKDWAWIAKYNPLAVIIESARGVVLYGHLPDFSRLGIVLIISLLVLQLGYAWFMKSKRGFADVL